jgi:molecular chaperone GrpE
VTTMRDDSGPEGNGQDIPVEVEADNEATTRQHAQADDATPEAALAAKVAELEKEKKDTYERLLRTTADFDNFRKRTRKENEDARLKGREEILKEILPGIDNLERALAAAADASQAANVADGVKLVLRQFLSALERFDVKGFSSKGEPFDPSRHEAVSQIPRDDLPAGSVAEEMQRGYMIGPRLLRPAMVAVAVGKPGAAADDAGGGAGEVAPADESER